MSSDITNVNEENDKILLKNIQSQYIQAIKNLINNNPILLSPYREGQTIEVALALLALNQEDDLTYIHSWLEAMLDRIRSNFLANQTYPSTLSEYSKLIKHPAHEQGYKEKVTQSSVLYAFLATYAAVTGMQDIYDSIKILYRDYIGHCNLQAWYLSDDSEAAIWKNSAAHGATLADLNLNKSMHEWQEEVFYQCKNSATFKELSAIKYGSPCLLLIACRHHQYPLPYDFFL